MEVEAEEEILEFKFISGNRKSSKLLYVEKEEQIYKFQVHKKQSDVKYYYCHEQNCKVGVAVEFNSNKYCRKIKNKCKHNHGPQTELLKKFELLNVIKSEVAKNPLKRAGIREVFDEQCKKFKDAAQYVEFGKMRKQLNNIKQEVLPKSPLTFEDIISVFQIENVYKQFGISRFETNEKPFYIDTVITQNFSYTLFASPTITNYVRSMAISEPRNYILYATFSIVPSYKKFKQLLIIHILHAEHVSIALERNHNL